jgi:hypothetical protein
MRAVMVMVVVEKYAAPKNLVFKIMIFPFRLIRICISRNMLVGRITTTLITY